MKRKYNYDLVFRQIYSESGVSRADLARSTGLTRATISYIVDYFIKENYFVIKYENTDENKRTGEKIYINEKRDLIMCLEIKKHLINAYITYGDGTLLDSYTYNYNENIETIFGQIKDLCIKKEIKIIGIAVHGIVDNMGKDVYSTYYAFNGQNIHKQFADKGIEVFFEKDANVYNNAIDAIEYVDSEYKSNASLIVGEGIGYSLMIANQIIYGINGDFGAVGHLPANIGTEACYCGRKGCYEIYATSEVFVKEFNKMNDCEFTDEQIIEHLNNQILNQNERDLLSKYIAMHVEIINYTATSIGTNKLHYIANFFNQINIYNFKIVEILSNDYSIEIKPVIDKNKAIFRKGFSRQLLRVLYDIDEK